MSAAFDLQRDGNHQITLIESSNRLGGKIITHYHDDLIVEGGPDSVFTSKPAAVELMEELGLESEFVEPIGSGFSLYVGGKLHVVPRAMASLIPSASSALESLGFLSSAARKRIRSEGEVPKGAGDDESIASFFRRRFGTRFSKTLAEPLLAGIHAGDAEILSMKALYPTYIGMEQKNGKLTTEAHPPTSGSHPHPARKPGFLTLRSGLQKLVDVLQDQLSRVDIRLNTRIDTITKDDAGVFHLAGSDNFEADILIFAIPGSSAANYLKTISPKAGDLLAKIRYASTAVVTVAYPLAAFPKGLHDNGFLVPADEKIDITGCTFSSTKWPGRAPANMGLVRMFMGRDGGMNVDTFSDDDLLGKAIKTVEDVLHVKEKPSFTQVDRWSQAMPQYAIGHTDLMDGIEEALSELPIYLVGGSYRGTGIPDCIRQGRQAAFRILEKIEKAA